MRNFEIYVENGKVACDKDVMHVRPDTVENIAVFLKSGLEEEYTMDNLVIKDNSEPWLTPQRLNTSTIILHDNNMNNKPGKPRFCVKLTPRGPGIPKVKKLDPMVVNE